MSIRVQQMMIYDGDLIEISAEGGSAKEALAIVREEGENLGCAPYQRIENGKLVIGTKPLVAAGADAPPSAPRTRRTKAQIEADEKAAAEAKAAQPITPPAPLAGAFDPPAPPLPNAPTVTMTSAPPLAEAPASVAISAAHAPSAPPAPPPPPSPEQQARGDAKAVVDALLASVPDTWHTSVHQQVATLAAGKNVDVMTLPEATAFKDAVLRYRAVCDAAAR